MHICLSLFCFLSNFSLFDLHLLSFLSQSSSLLSSYLHTLTHHLIMLPISMASEDKHLHIFQRRFIEINPSNFHFYSHGIFLLLFFFSLIILIVTLFLLAQVCRRRYITASLAPPATSLQWGKFEMEAMENKSVGDLNVECCICLSVLKEGGGKVKVLPECEHAYHSECVEIWLSANPSCPLCRASLHMFMSHNAINNNNTNISMPGFKPGSHPYVAGNATIGVACRRQMASFFKIKNR